VFRKIILAVASFALVCVAFLIYQSRDEDRFAATQPEVPRPPVRAAVTQPGAAQPLVGDQKGALIGGWQNVLPGGGSKIHVYDRGGEAKYIFEAAQWEPVSDTEYHMTKPSARVLLPDGQLAYVQADEGQVKVRQAERQKIDPTSGWFKGNVRIIVDRTKPDWRRDNPDKAAPETHPETIDRIFLDDARFDLDLARLETDGPIRVESERGSLEGLGFEMVWNEVTRRVKLAKIRQGGRATVRGQELAQFGDLSGDGGLVEAESGSGATDQAGGAVATQEAFPDAVVDAEAEEDGENREISFLDPDAAARQVRKDRIDTYQVVFRDNIVATQRQGDKVTGGLKGAQTVTLITDLGREERAAVEFTSKGRKAGGKRGQPGAKSQPASRPPDSGPPGSTPAATQPGPPESALELVWTGEVTLMPIESSETQPSSGPATASAPLPQKRTHLIVEGERMELQDSKQGTIICRKLEVHNETKQIWLTGSKECPAVMSAGADSRVLVYDTLFVDRQAGMARITGPGMMIRREAQPSGPDTRPAGLRLGQGGPEEPAVEFELAWQKGGQIDFDRAAVEAPHPTAGEPPITKQVVYLKHAAFQGGVDTGLSNQRVAADEIDVVFAPPEAKLELRQKARQSRADKGESSSPIDTTQALQVVATGNVRMSQRSDLTAARQGGERTTDLVTCKRLEIEMGTDDTGRNVPRIAKAFGKVSAEQTAQPFVGPIPVGVPQVRDIRADDQIVIELASVPRPIADAQRQQFEAYARERGYTEESPEWQRWEQKIKNRRQIVLKRMMARGNVTARDEKQDLNDLAGDSVEFLFDAAGKISTALVVGRSGAPARIDHNTFYIRGQQISLNMELQSVEVPGTGLLRFYSDQDLDGRPLEKRIPIEVTWNNQMWLRGKENAGTFTGRVRGSSENNVLESSELRLRFADVAKRPASVRPSATVARGLGAALWPRQQKRPRNALEERVKKKLVRVDASGNAVVLSSAYEQATNVNETRVAAAIKSMLPDILRVPASRPSRASDRRLLSRVRAAGPQIRIDLEEQQFLIEGQGNLLVEDYRLPKAGRGAGREGPQERRTVLAPSSLPGAESVGPSQTLFTWANSFTFLNRKFIAVLDNQVVMRHAAGAQMALADRIESALKLDEETRKRITSRAATLTCGNLVVQFQRDKDGKTKSPGGSLSGATALKGFQARGNVFFTSSEADLRRSASGLAILYDAVTGLAEISGTTLQEAVIEEAEVRTGRSTGYWHGLTVKWNLKTRQIEAEGSKVNAPRGRQDQTPPTGLRQLR